MHGQISRREIAFSPREQTIEALAVVGNQREEQRVGLSLGCRAIPVGAVDDAHLVVHEGGGVAAP